MARRVNTKFVVILGAVLLLGAVGVTAVMYKGFFKGRDPKFLQAQAEEAEKKGDLQAAHRFWGLTASQLSIRHDPKAADAYDKFGDLSMTLSGTTAETFDAQRYYMTAMDAWKHAKTENPQYLPAQT